MKKKISERTLTSKQAVTQMNNYWKDLHHALNTDAEKKKSMDMRFGIKDIKLDSRGNIISFNKYKRGQYEDVKIDEALIAEAGDICALNRGVLRSKSMQAVWEKKCAPKLNNQTLGEDKMEKLVDTVRKVLAGEEAELSDKQKAYRKFFDKTLKKFDIKSPADLKGDEEKKKFYDYIDKNWTAEHEEEIEVKKETVKKK